MTEYKNKENKGALFKVIGKQTPTHPDYTGGINIEGTEYWLNAWISKSKKGTTYMSLSVTKKEVKPKQERCAPAPGDEDIPF